MTLLFIFIAAFLITAPIVVLYTAGYRYSFDTNRIVQTGLFYVTSLPKEAVVLVDNKNRGKTPAFIKRLIPGDYTLELIKEGYHSWSKTLPIASHETTFVEEIVLFLDQEPINLISQEITTSAVDPEKTTLAYVTVEPSWLEVWVFDTEMDKQTLLYRSADTTTDTIDLTWSSDGTRLLVGQTFGQKTEYVVVDKAGYNRIELASITSETIINAWWHTADANNLFFTTRSGTYLYRTLSETVSEIYPRPALATLSEGQALIVGESGDKMSVFKYHDQQAQIIAYLPLGNYAVLPSPSPYLLLHEAGRNILTLINTTIQDQPILLNVDGHGAQWSNDQTKLLYYSNFEVHVYDVLEHTDDLLTRVGEPINTATWYPGEANVLVAQADRIEAIELDWRDQRNIVELAAGTDMADLWITKNGRAAYFVGKINPDRGLFELILQER